MSVFKKRPSSRFYSFDFIVAGRRFLGSTEATTKKDAEAVEKRLKQKAETDIAEAKKLGEGPLILRVATGRFWKEVGKGHKDAQGTHHQLELLIEFFGPNKRLDEITDDDVVQLVAWRSAQAAKNRRPVIGDGGKETPKLVSNATINRTTVEPLRKLFMRARKFWKMSFPQEPHWSQHRLKEPVEHTRELRGDEDEALRGAQREDYAPWFAFARATALRLAETLLTWDCVNWEAKVITTIGKGGKIIRTPITPAIAEIIGPLREHHPEAVFTYVCQRPRKGQVKGKRYPITYFGARSEWRSQIKRSGVKGFRFHDVRHDTATKLLRQTQNLKLVSKVLNHSDIKTTARYAHVLDEELAGALQTLAEARGKSPAISPATSDAMSAKLKK